MNITLNGHNQNSIKYNTLKKILKTIFQSTKFTVFCKKINKSKENVIEFGENMEVEFAYVRYIHLILFFLYRIL